MSPSSLSYQDYEDAVFALKAGKLAVLPTDTIYGIVCSALQPEAVERLFKAKRRIRSKPCIVLIDSLKQLRQFGVDVSPPAHRALNNLWPGPTSVVLPVAGGQWQYLHGGSGSLAFRLPDEPLLRRVLTGIGPLLAPSANTEGLSPATTIVEAKDYFGSSVAAYVDGGRVEGSPSRLVRLNSDGSLTLLRD